MMKHVWTLGMVMAVSGATAAYAAPPQPQASVVASQAGDRTSKAAEALSRGETLEALARADEAVRAEPRSGWAQYNRAAALAALKRVDEAVAAYDLAAANFPAKDARGRSLALWGKAHVLYRVGRCTEASQAFGEYSKVVGSSDPQAVTLASERATSCHPAKGTETAPMAATKAKPEPAPVASSAKPEPEAKPALVPEPKSAMPSLAKP